MNNFLALLLFTFLFSACKNDNVTQQPVTPQPPGPVIPGSPLFRILDSSQMVSDLQQLSSDAFKGRKAGMPEIALTHELIRMRLRASHADSFAVGYSQNFNLGSTARKNLIGFKRGSLYPGKYIVAGAHFDHLGVNSSGVVFHGADDNASGVAAVLAMAKYFDTHPPAYSIIYGLWDAEESGLKGSEFFVNNLPAGILLADIKFNLNLDMIARSDNNSLWASGLSHFPSFRYLVDSIKTKTITQLKSGYDNASHPQDWTLLSDHASFYAKGIPYLYLGVEDHADYHKVTDTYSKINLNRFVENANIAAQMILLLDRKL